MTVNQNDLKNKLAEKVKTPVAKKGKTIFDLIREMEPAIKKALPKQISVDRFSRVVMTAVRTNPKLQTCTPESFLAAMMQSAQLGLEPNTPLGQAYLIPYGKEVQFQLGYQGMLALAYRTGEYKSIYAMPVYKNDKFEYEYGLNERLVHVPAPEPEGEPIYYYAVYHLKNGGYGFVVMSREQIEQHRDKYSQAAKQGRNSPWNTDFDAMAKKTVLKQLLKYAPKSVEFAAALLADETVKKEIAEDMTEIPPIEVTGEIIEEDVQDVEVQDGTQQEIQPESGS
ncbi:recombinase, phage RecT family [Thermoanaerobacter thermohydrosulfuricus WC1]|uniref:Recombinase, phage RecT family n=1 Tax=Thermoanaerobacter thermohydrosulfuricus WC1 TaxID=1198630 RepID=M8CUN7_THETY|nr:recombinase RecT [Thermoanaerobacter thermohydrosulfuricus]EMT38144.1 recombinase, phage RecT family [Thermoanaerobacter thermohydrosulfuricus WC1]